ncbi:hypothetical protein CFP56_014260 [Quercus suber]|uniref:Uncharacterized protein n=1 Tax=Quercus suber TaxID=58331 RepID=A0AAW0KUZ4_QUESU
MVYCFSCFFFVTTLFLELLVSLCIDDRYSSCSTNAYTFNCGEITGSWPSQCLWQSSELTCEKNITPIDTMNMKYRVLEMDSKTKRVHIAKEDDIDGIYLSNFVNSKLDSKLFQCHTLTKSYHVTLLQNLTIIYGCKN